VEKPIVPAGEFRRYQISLKDSNVKYKVISEDPIELPRINYKYCNTKPYRFAYGVSHEKTNPNDFLNRLIKIDTEKDSSFIWREDNCYPGEPVFVPSPNATAEDQGVIISVVLDTKKSKSFLLVLDAASFEEKARAEVPHHIPFGFHGQYYANIS
jgi:carotenoid cleavage dioxygenase-like enzyme